MAARSSARRRSITKRPGGRRGQGALMFAGFLRPIPRSETACSQWHGSTWPARPTMMRGATKPAKKGWAMAGNLRFEELSGGGRIGHNRHGPRCAMVDMQGRLIGKRFQAEYFVDSAHEETHGCDYLLGHDIDMEPVPGYEAASWEKGYGDFVLKPDMATLRRCPGSRAPLWSSADVLDHQRIDDVAAFAAGHAQAPAGAA